MSIQEAKKKLREQLKAERSSLDMLQVVSASELVDKYILACDAYCRARCIMGYLAFGRDWRTNCLGASL